MIKRLRKYWSDRTTRRRFLLGSVFGGVGAAGSSYAYMRLWESGWIEINRHKITASHPNDPIRILHLSDLHASRAVSLGYLRRAIQTGLDQKPDLICLTGDFITWKYRQFEEYAKVLSPLSEMAPAYACLGNHDGGSWAHGRMKIGMQSSQPVKHLLEQSGIELLHNRNTTVTINNRSITLVGLGDLWNRECRPSTAFAETETQNDTVVLSHNPDTKDLISEQPWTLMLSGHTHGGQVFLPGLGAPLAPVKDKRFVRGLHRYNDRWIHITKGLGNLHGLRLNCRPEVSVLDYS